MLLMLVLVAGTGWLLRELETTRVTGGGEREHIPDFYMETFTTTTMNASGRPERRLHAPYMEHFPDDTSEFERPYLILYDEPDPPWHVRSERGWASADGEVILFLGDVFIWRDDENGERALEIETQDLRVLPETEYGETDRPVVIRTPKSETRGVGMRTYLAENRLELLSRVHTVYYQHEREL